MFKVLHIITSSDVGGAEKMLEKLCAHDLKRKNVVISLRPKGTIAFELEKLGIPVFSMNMTSGRQFFSITFKLHSLIKLIEPDIILTWLPHSNLIGGFSSLFTQNTKLIWSIRQTTIGQDISFVSSMIIRIGGLFSRFLPKKIISCSIQAKKAHTRIGYISGKITVIPNGFQIMDFEHMNQIRHSFREKLGMGNQDRLIGIVGRFDPIKDHKLFVDVASMVNKKYQGLKFIMVGRGLDDNNVDLVCWLKQAKIYQNTILVGEVANVSDYLSAMDIFCLTSRSEGFPNVVGEAMSMRVPCVVTDVGDAAYLVGNTGRVVPPNSKHEFTQGLIDILDLSVEELTGLGNKAYERIRDCFSIDYIHQQYDLVYNEVLSQ